MPLPRGFTLGSMKNSQSAGAQLERDLLDAALGYARRGWQVFPVYEVTKDRSCACRKADCKDPGKHPRTAHGVKDASTSETTIRAWWRQWPMANVGIATGAESGLIVVDVDPRHGGDESLGRLEEQYGLFPKTPWAWSGGNGEHIYLRHPGKPHIVRNIQTLGGFPGLDLKADGGYIIADPSSHVSGRRYEWKRSSHPDRRDVASAPQWLLDLARPRISDEKKGTGELQDWLKLLKGVAEGERHTVAARITGHYLAFGWDPEEIEAMLLGFAAQCVPPHDPDDIRRVVADLAAAEHQKVSAQDEQSQRARDTAPPWPTLHPDALLGLVGDIVETIDPYTEADRVAVLINLLSAFGNLVGPRPHFRVEATKHPCRLFVVQVGETAKGRKGTAWSTPRALLGEIDSDWAAKRVTSGLSSGEGLIFNVRDPRIEKKPTKKSRGKGFDYHDLISDHGEPDKRLLVVEEEFSQVLKVMKREGNILSPVLRQAWDSGDLHPLTKTNPIRATGAHITIIGHGTREEILRHLTETDQANGFANRFIWVLVKRSKVIPKPTGVPEAKLAPLVRELHEAVNFADQADEMVRSQTAERQWAEVYPNLSEGKPGLLGAILGRAEVQVMRIACIYALFDRSREIKSAHLSAALALWDYAEASARRIFGSRIGDPVADRILAALRTRGALSETDIHELFSRHRAGVDISRALELLEHRGVAARQDQRDTGGRPRTTWRPTSHDK